MRQKERDLELVIDREKLRLKVYKSNILCILLIFLSHVYT